MKKIAFLIIVVITCPEWILSQSCLPEGINFSTQNQVDSFHINYPGCTKIEGNVMIGSANGSSDITNLYGLSTLTTIDGRLSIGESNTYMPLPYLTSLSGLENLVSIGGSLIIYSSPLTSMLGLEGLTYIGDSLIINFNEFLTSLTGLHNLISVGGSFFIGQLGNPMLGNPALASLAGLENLTLIGDDLLIGNTALTNLTGLENLTSIGGDFWLIDAEYGPGNPFLTSLTGLENLTSIGGRIIISGNNALTSLTGLNNVNPGSITYIDISNNSSLSTCHVKCICEYLAGSNGHISFSENASGCNSRSEVEAACETLYLPEGIIFTTQNQIDSFQINYPGCTEILGNVIIGDVDGTSDITDLNGLNNLSSIQGSLCFGVYPFFAPQYLASLSGLENLTSIGGSLKFYNVALTNLSGLEGLASIGDSLLISHNSLLTSLTGLNNLISIGGSFFIGQPWTNPMLGNPALASLTGLENLTSIGDELFIVSTALTNMTGLENLIFIGGNLGLISNLDLTSLSGLESLTCIGGGLYIGDSEFPMSALTSLTGLDNLISIGEDLWISGNSHLTNLSGLEKLTSIGSSFTIIGNNSLISLTGLDNLNSIGGLDIQGNNHLTSLAGLEGLTSIGGFFAIVDNDALASLIGLEGITSGSINGLVITDNQILSTCDVRIVCDYLVNPKVVLYIQNNASGCDSLYEVKSACGVGVDESNVSESQLNIYPNPSSNKFTFSFTLKQSAQVNLEVWNSVGKVVATILDESMSEGTHEVTYNAENLPSGIYFYCLRAGNLSSTGKMLVIR